uniref:Uncharacterized protein n=1 Tax=Nothoprocta perdicaria TaxID=30464 RepID=A0A8C6YMG8_NOTPE
MCFLKLMEIENFKPYKAPCQDQAEAAGDRGEPEAHREAGGVHCPQQVSDVPNLYPSCPQVVP